MTSVVIGKVGDIPPGGTQNCRAVPGQGLVLVSLTSNGSFYAVRNICPHKNGPLCTGELSGRVTTDAPPSTHGATIAVDGLGEILRCPWHQWAFDIATGRCLVDPEIRAKTYPVKVKGDNLVVEYEE